LIWSTLRSADACPKVRKKASFGEKRGKDRVIMVVTELLIHLCWFPIILANHPTVSTGAVQIENENNSQEIQAESTWKVRLIEEVKQILREKINTPPTRAVKTSSQNTEYWNRQKVGHLSRQVNLTRMSAQNILAHIKERNDTASKSLWERSAKSAGEAKQLAEEAASFTKDLVQNLSEERKEKAVATIASHIKAQISSNNWRISQFHNTQKTTGAVLMRASKESFSEFSNMKSELRSFRREAKRKVDAVRQASEVYVNQTINYLHLAEHYSSYSEEIQSLYAPLDQVAAFAKDEAIRFAEKASQESLNDIQKKFDSFKGVKEKPKHFEEAIQSGLNKTKSAHKETIKSWTRTNNDAMGISRTFFKFREVQSVIEKSKSAIDRASVDIENAKQSSQWKAIEENLEKMSDSVEQVVKTGSDLAMFEKNLLDMEQTMYGIWAQFYGYGVRRRVWRLKDYISRINQTNPVELLAEEDLKAAVKKWNEAKEDGQHIAKISLAAVEDTTREMKQNVDLVQVVFHATEAKAKAISEKYREQCFVAFREAEAILAESNLAVAAALDEITEITTDNYRKTNVLVLEAEAIRKWTYLFFLPLGVVLAGVCMAAIVRIVSCKKLLRGHHAYLADIKTEEDLLKLSERQMKEVLEMCGVEISDDAKKEELLELLKQLWIHGERSPALMEEKYVVDDEVSKCKVCMDADIDCVILGCGHLVTCNQCGKKLTECPICRQQVLEVLCVAPVTEQEMLKLTTQQVKHVLMLCGVGFKDRVSARRKVEEGAILEKEHKCKVCMERVIDCVFLGCGHLMTCTCCGQKLVSCPICQKRIVRVAKIYRT